eukprot:gene7753-9091_t
MVMQVGGKIKRKRGISIPNAVKMHPDVTIDDMMKQNFLKIGDRLAYSIGGETHMAILLKDGYIEYCDAERQPSVHAWITTVLSRLTPNKRYHWFSPWDSIFVKGKSLNHIRKLFEGRNKKYSLNYNTGAPISQPAVVNKKRSLEPVAEVERPSSAPDSASRKESLSPAASPTSALKKLKTNVVVKREPEEDEDNEPTQQVDMDATIKIPDDFDSPMRLEPTLEANSDYYIDLSKESFSSQNGTLADSKDNLPTRYSPMASNDKQPSPASSPYKAPTQSPASSQTKPQTQHTKSTTPSPSPASSQGGASQQEDHQSIASSPHRPASQMHQPSPIKSIDMESPSFQTSMLPPSASMGAPSQSFAQPSLVSQDLSAADGSYPPPYQLPKTPTGPVILGTGLTSLMQRHISTLVSAIGGKLVDQFSPQVTHIVCATEDESKTISRRTLKYQLGIVTGMWLVNFDWILTSLNEGRWVEEEEFEIEGDAHALGSPNKARQQLLFGSKRLFYGQSFYFVPEGGFEAPTIDELKALVKESGGIILSSPPPKPQNQKELLSSKCTVICDPSFTTTHQQSVDIYLRTKHHPVSFKWIFDSISHYQLLPKDKYIVFSKISMDAKDQESMVY